MASSFGVQCVTGIPRSFGALQASAMICVNCSAENFGGTPLRSSSAITSNNTASNSSSEVSAFDAASSRVASPANLRRHRFTRCSSTPSARACSTLVLPSPDQRTIRTLSASRRSNFRNRASRSRIVRTRSFNVTGRAGRDMLSVLILSPQKRNPVVTSAWVY
jgi:hypothetical protein